MRWNRLGSAVFCAVLMAVLCAVPARAVSFSDIGGHWAEDSIRQATAQGWFSGIKGSRFAPDAPLTRAWLASVLADCSDAPLPQTGTAAFSDVAKDSWYAPAVRWAVQSGVMTGTSETTFSPDQAVTREQLAVALIGCANESGTVLPRARGGRLFSDMDACSDDTLDALYTLYRADVLDATDDGAIRPDAAVTRADCAAILCRYQAACSGTCQPREQAAVISHMGYSHTAPENTLPAYVESDAKQYTYVEADVRFTRDNVPVLLHDPTIDRTSNGSGAVSDLTYAQLKTYDFCAKQTQYDGVHLPTFRQFIRLCAQRYLHPYIELKPSMSGRQLEQLFDIVSDYRMTSHVTWISFDYANLRRIRSRYPTAELGYLHSDVGSACIRDAARLRNGTNRVYLCARHTGLTPALRSQCLRAGVYLETWTIRDRETAVRQLNTSAQGVTVDVLTIEDLYGEPNR